MMLIRSGVFFGVVIWAAATAIFIPFGHVVFGPDNRLPVSVSAGLIIVATFFAVRWFAAVLLRRFAVTTIEQGALLGVSICVPGLILDGTLYALNSGRYPGLGESASGAMSAGLLLAYAAALLATLDAARKAAAPLQRRFEKST